MEDSSLTELLRIAPFFLNGVRVDPSALQLSGPQGESTLEPKVMALLVALCDRPGELWCRSELMDVVWPKGQSSDESLTRLVSILRRILKSDHGITVVTTVPKLGYRLEAEVTPAEALSQATTEPPQIEPPLAAANTPRIIFRPDRRKKSVRVYILGTALAFTVIFALLFRVQGQGQGKEVTNTKLPSAKFALLNRSGSSLAVLPIESLTRDESLAFIADGMMRDLTAQLSRIPSLHIAPYLSARAFKNEFSETAVADSIGVRYIVSGSLTEQRGHVDLRIDFADTELGQSLWSKRFSKSLEEFFKMRDQVIQEIATTVFFEIQAAEIEKIRAKDTAELSAYELTQKAEGEREVYSHAAFKRVIDQLYMALKLDPDNPAILSRLATQLTQGTVSGFSSDPQRDIKLAMQYLEQARALAPRDAQVLMGGGIISFITGETQKAERLLEMSLAAAPNGPNEPHTTAMLGLTKCFLGNPELGLTLIRRSEQHAFRNPRFGAWAFYRGICHYVQNDWVSASSALRDAIDRNPNYSSPYVHLAFVDCALGKEAEGRRLYRQALHLFPQFTLSDWMLSLDATNFPDTPGFSVVAIKQIAQNCLEGDQI